MRNPRREEEPGPSGEAVAFLGVATASVRTSVESPSSRDITDCDWDGSQIARLGLIDALRTSDFFFGFFPRLLLDSSGETAATAV